MAKRKHRVSVKAEAAQSPAWARKLDSDVFAILMLAAVWLAAILLINPRGNFPLNDDWCYGRAVFDLIHTGVFHPANIVSMPIIGQVVWAVPFCSIFGATFDALRISTLVLAFGGILALYGLLREARMPRWAAFFGSAVLALSPLYLFLSHGFMTDVPSVAFMLIAMYCYVRALRTDSLRMIFLGTVPACAAVLTRQIGLFVPVGFALAYLVGYGVRPKSVLKAVLPALISVAAYQGYLHWLISTDRLPAMFNMQSNTIHRFVAGGPAEWIQSVLRIGLTWYAYCGLLLLPFLILTVCRPGHLLSSRHRRVNFLVSMISGLLVMGALACQRRWMPVDGYMKGEYIWDFGMGPMTLYDTWEAKIAPYDPMPEWFWIMVTVAAVIGGAILLWHVLTAIGVLVSRHRQAPTASDRAFLVLALAIAAMNFLLLLPISMFAYFDRYFLCIMAVSIPMLALTTGPSLRPTRLRIAGALLTLLLIGAFGVCGTHDYLAWNRLRWQAGEEMLQVEHVNPHNINAGNEFSAWYCYDDRTLEWDVSNDYIVTFGSMPGYDEVRRYTYVRWMPAGEGTICVLKKREY